MEEKIHDFALTVGNGAVSEPDSKFRLASIPKSREPPSKELESAEIERFTPVL
jgi:hypothetical protein